MRRSCLIARGSSVRTEDIDNEEFPSELVQGLPF